MYAVLVAGGTGGHINAALALGESLQNRKVRVRYLSGQRPLDYKLFKDQPVEHLASWPLRTKNPLKLLSSIAKNFLVFINIWRSFRGDRPDFVFGAGGYVCGPTLLAAWTLGVPIFILEQNAVLGLTNRLLARLCTRVFTHFKQTRGIPQSLNKKVLVVGNPTRASISFSPARTERQDLRVLVFGGSLGATQINQLIQSWVGEDQSLPVSLVHQSGQDIQAQPKLGKNVSYSSYKYLDNIQEQYRWCDVVIARAGASTVSELRIVRKPSFLIPFPGATDNHQWWNAKNFQAEVDYHVEVIDPQLKAEEALKSLREFLQQAAEGKLRSTQLAPVSEQASELALREIFQHVGPV